MSNPLLEILQQQVANQALSGLGKQLGIENESQVNNAGQSAINLILNGLMKNASNSGGLGALAGALDKDHDGSILDDLAGYVSGSAQVNPRTANGTGILKHILGDKLGPIIGAISQQNNLSQDQSMGLLTKLAPLVLGSIGKTKRNANLDNGGLLDLLQNSAQTYNEPRKDNSILENLLDRDGDGNIKDDVAGIGMKILGNLFKR